MSLLIPRPAEWDLYEAYFLAGWPCEQGLRTVIPALPDEPLLVDIGAASGVFAQRARLIKPHATIVGVEIRTDERAAARHYDRWIERDVFAVERELRDLRPHLVMSNPAFTRTLPKLQLALRIVRPGGFVLFHVRGDWGRSVEASDFLYRCPPLIELEIGGRPHYLAGKKPNGEDYGTDMTGAKWLLWQKGARFVPGEWLKRQLERLPSASMEWNVRPGTEPEASPLPEVFWPKLAIGGRS